MEDTATVDTGVFDPTKVDINHPNINAVFARAIVDNEAQNSIRVNWVHDYNQSADHPDNQRPAWADLPINQRVYMTLPDKLVNYMTRAVLNNPNRFVHELPCPPYTFDMDEGMLRIKAGAFEKSGSKDEWTTVIHQMQEEVEAMPDAIDVSELPDITLDIDIKASLSHDVSVDTLLESNEQYEDGQWLGDKDDLESALEHAIDDYEIDEYDLDLGYFNWDETQVTGNDLDYCMRQVNA